MLQKVAFSLITTRLLSFFFMQRKQDGPPARHAHEAAR